MASDSTLSDDDCFALCVMTHGQLRTLATSDDGTHTVQCECLLGTDGAFVPTTRLLAPFSNERCPQLRGKPKIVVFQACRGGVYNIRCCDTA